MNDFPPLMNGAHPELYRANAFRLGRLAVDAGPRDIARQLDRLKILEKLGTAGNALAAPLPVDTPPSSETVRTALERLRDPESRVLEEFFWFWPLTRGQSATDPALGALTRGDAEEARALWWQCVKGSIAHKGIAYHNLAVLAHVRALDLEFAADGDKALEQAQADTRDVCWLEAYGHWRELIADDAFWTDLADYYQGLHEPQIGPQTAQRLRGALPAALLSIGARLAVRAAQKGQPDEARRHLALAAGSGFDLEELERAFRFAAEGLWERIKLLRQNTESEMEAAPEQAHQAARRFGAAAGPVLAVLDGALPARHRLRAAAHDEVALTLLRCQIAYADRTHDWNTSVELLQDAQSVAQSASARERLQENIEIVRQNAKALLCWFCEANALLDGAAINVPMYGNVTRHANGFNYQLRWQQFTVKIPRCRQCRSAHRRREGFTLLGGLLGGLIGLGGYALLMHTSAWFPALLLISVCMIGGAVLGSSWSMRRFGQGIKRIDEKKRFPQIEYLQKQGWALGHKPPGA